MPETGYKILPFDLKTRSVYPTHLSPPVIFPYFMSQEAKFLKNLPCVSSIVRAKREVLLSVVDESFLTL